MISEQDMKNLDGKKIDDDHISTETLHYIRDGNQTHLNIDKGKHGLKYLIASRKRNCNVKEC